MRKVEEGRKRALRGRCLSVLISNDVTVLTHLTPAAPSPWGHGLGWLVASIPQCVSNGGTLLVWGAGWSSFSGIFHMSRRLSILG